MLLGRNCAWLLMIDKSFSLRMMIIFYITAFVITCVRTQSASITVRIVAQRHILSASQDPLDVSQRRCRLLFPLSPEMQEIFSFVDVLNLEQCANHRHGQSMSPIIGCDLSGQLTYWYQTDSYRQTIEIAWHQISASSFLENSTSFMSVAFEGCNFVATSLHFLLWLLALCR